MQHSNMSDLIENYLKKVIAAEEQVEIRRSEIADRFNCVPSQINYVINTRFTVQKGYIVESKRGGGGYIRIMKVQLVDDIDIIDSLLALIRPELSLRQAVHMIHNLYEHELITKREAELMLVAIDKETLDSMSEDADRLRSKMMKVFLNKLKYE